MKDARVVAAINLFAVLRNLEDLCALDSEASDLVKGANLTVRFSVPSLETLNLLFNEGRCRVVRGEIVPSAIHLRFISPMHFNGMINGVKNPILTKGFSKLKFLKNNFTALTKRLEFFLKPTEKMLIADEAFSKNSTILTAYTAFYALSEVANYDNIGRAIANKMENGKVCIRIKGGPSLTLSIKNGKMTTLLGEAKNISAYMDFDTIKTAEGILRGTLDSFACIGNGSLAISGRIPLIDNINKLLNIVSAYLA